MQQAVGSYDQTMQALVFAERGAYGDLSYMPVFRASALFYAFSDKYVNTRIAFLNYWREKNHNHDVGVLVTVRDRNGIKCARTFNKLSEMTYDFDLRLLLGNDHAFHGSIEIEAFSSQDLKFQFPGLSVFYETPSGVSYVHANQRTYNDAEDRARGVALNPWQTGFRLDAAKHDPFIFIVNGPVFFPGGEVDFVVVREDGRELWRKLTLQPLSAYATLDIRTAGIEGVHQFLGDKLGMCKIDLPLDNVHLRLVAGNALRDKSWLSVTHSYFDATEHSDYFDTSGLDPSVYPAFVPFVLPEELDVDLVLYPIYARSTIDLRLQGYGTDGNLRFEINLGEWRSPEDGMRHLKIRKLVRDQGIDDSPGLYVLQLRGKNHQLPARITYGLDFHAGDSLGTNISSSAYLAKTWGSGRRTWKWGPVVAKKGGRNLIMVTAFSKIREEFLERKATLTFYARHGPVAQKTLDLRGNAALTLVAEDLMAAEGYVPSDGDILWYVLRSDHATLDVNQVCISSDGLVGGDHSF